tara:strand:+ start:717 stop:857 length:141 start_codon:yes stop_codon:yes gene_type:complete
MGCLILYLPQRFSSPFLDEFMIDLKKFEFTGKNTGPKKIWIFFTRH